MCVRCDSAREVVGAEIVRRTGVNAADVEKVLLAMETMQAEAAEQMEKQEEALRSRVGGLIEALTGPDGGEALREMIADGTVTVVDVDAAGFPAPAPAHERDVPEERLPGLYL